jgi:hypothetical protein
MEEVQQGAGEGRTPTGVLPPKGPSLGCSKQYLYVLILYVLILRKPDQLRLAATQQAPFTPAPACDLFS